MRRGAHATKTHCPQGHPYDAANTITYRNFRYCRLCQTAHKRAWYERAKAKTKRLETTKSPI
jgi:hypothetical protein